MGRDCLVLMRIALGALLLCSLGDGAFGFMPRGAGGVPATTPPPIFDTIPCVGAGCSGGSSSFKLRTAYLGNAIRLSNVQSSVTHTLDIGFVGNVIDSATADAFAALADAGTDTTCTIEYDQSGNGNNRVTTGPGGAPLVWLPAASPSPLANPRGCVSDQFANSTADLRNWQLPSGSSLSEDAMSAVFIGRVASSYPNAMMGFWGLGGVSSPPGGSGNTTVNFFTGSINGSGSTAVADGAQIVLTNHSATPLDFGFVETGPAMYMTTFSASQVCLTVNDLTYSCQAKPTLSTTLTSGWIGRIVAAGDLLGGGIVDYADIFWDKTLSPTEQTQLRTWSNFVLGNPQNVTKKLVKLCDSISQSEHVKNGQNDIFTMFQSLSHPLRVWNDATDGTTITQHVASIARDTAIINAGDIALINCGTNDTGDIPTGLSTLATDLHNAGAVVFCTTLTANSARTSGQSQTINNLITGGVSGCDHIIDMWNPSTSLVGVNGNPLDATCFADGVHPTALCQGIGTGAIGNQEAAAINAVFP